MSDILQPAITLGKEGFPIHEFSAFLQHHHKDDLRNTEHSYGNDLLLEKGEIPQHGDVMTNPKLAAVFEVNFW